MVRKYSSYIASLHECVTRAEYKSLNFAVYGLGVTAKQVIEELSGEVKIIGLMDRDAKNIGVDFYGYPVISEDEAIQIVDCIIIAANEINWSIISKRIGWLRDLHNIIILYTNGQEIPRPEKCNIRPHNIELEKIWSKIKEYEVICFDIFDTLITRSLANPSDIFLYVEDRSKCKFNFNIVRKTADRLCKEEIGDAYTIDDIYRRIMRETGISKEEADILLALEIEAEVRFARRKPEIYDIFLHCLSAGKYVYLVSDMYLYASQIERILLACGISGHHGIFVSSEMGKTKKSGLIWPQVSSLIGDDFIHIGDDMDADILSLKNPSKTAYIMNYKDRLSLCGFDFLEPYVRNWEDSLAMGMLSERLFTEPINGFDEIGRTVITSPFNLGYMFLAPLMLSFIYWLVNQCNEISHLYFFSRDGHLLMRLYDEIIGLCGINAPEPIYLKISRRAVAVAGIRDENDILLSLEQPFSATISNILYNRFGVKAYVSDDEIYTNTSQNMLEVIMKHKNEILKNAEKERNCYIDYLKSIGIMSKKNVAVCDYGISGTIQFWLEKLLQCPLDGYYLTAYTNDYNTFGIGKRVHALFPERQFSQKHSGAFRFSTFLDGILTAPNGTMRYAVSANCIETESPGNKSFDTIRQIHDGISLYIKEYLTYSGRLAAPSKEFSDTVFSILNEGNRCIVSEEIKNVCLYDNAFLGQREGKITL